MNRALLARISSVLGIEGIKQFPSTLDLTDIKPVINLNTEMQAFPPAAPTFSTRSSNSGNFPAGTTLDVGVNLIGSSAVASLIPAIVGGVVPNASGSESRVLAISANVGYVAAGAAADAAAGVRLILLITLKNLTTNTLSFHVQDEFAVVENLSPYSYTWTFPQGSRFKNAGAQLQSQGSNSGWDGYIPPNHDCYMTLTRTGGLGFFPNLTSLDTYFMVAQRPFRGDWKA